MLVYLEVSGLLQALNLSSSVLDEEKPEGF